MATIRPFRGIRPRDDLAGQVIAPPYDTLSEKEARELAEPNPHSFLHITRPEVDLPQGTDVHSSPVYEKARDNLAAFIEKGWMKQDQDPCYYLYAQTWRGRTQVGLMALCSVDEYDRGIIKKHELTRPAKEQDRVDHMHTIGAQVGLVFLAYRDTDEIRRVLVKGAELPYSWRVSTPDNVTHTLTVLSDPEHVAAITQIFANVPALYIADGHHRSAAASRVAQLRGGEGTSGWFLAGIFPDNELQVLAYNRIVRDLGDHTAESFLEAVERDFEVSPNAPPIPSARGRCSMYLAGKWYGLVARPGVVPSDPVGRLDAQVLQSRILSPLLGITNPRTDERIDFVGGIRGPSALTEAVDSGEAQVAFHLYPTGMDQLFDVADADLLMPPKSTWFEPKLRGGVLVHKFD